MSGTAGMDLEKIIAHLKVVFGWISIVINWGLVQSERFLPQLLITIYTMTMDILNNFEVRHQKGLIFVFLSLTSFIGIFVCCFVLSMMFIQAYTTARNYGCDTPLDIQQKLNSITPDEEINQYYTFLVISQSSFQILSIMSLLLIVFICVTKFGFLSAFNLITFTYSLLMLIKSTVSAYHGDDYKLKLTLCMIVTLPVWVIFSLVLFPLWYVLLFLERVTCCMCPLAKPYLSLIVTILNWFPFVKEQKEKKKEKHADQNVI
jgi:hypothetical protein